MARIAVITPYYNEPISHISTCHKSISSQDTPCRQILIADGKPRKEVSDWDCDHIVLPCSHQDIGSTPRAIGSMHAIGMHYDFIAFLDADNWFAPDHIKSLIDACLSHNAVVASSSRTLCKLDGSIMAVCTSTDPECFIDTSCMLLGREAFPLIQNWVLMPSYGHLIGDRIFWHYIRASGLPRVHTGLPTSYYRCQKEGLYHLHHQPIPEGVQKRPNYEAAHEQWLRDGHPSLFL